jgi:peroxiredoxin
MSLLSPGSAFPAFNLHAYCVDGGFFEVDRKAIVKNSSSNRGPDVVREDRPRAPKPGGWSLFFFYPADFTFVCPTELEDLAEHQVEFDLMGVKVHSVSTDTHFAHKAWHDTSPAIGKIKYIMLGDPAHQLSRVVGALDEATGLARRVTYLVDPDGMVQFVEATADGIGRSAVAVLAKISAAQHVRAFPGEVCPAKWSDGGETLKPSLDLVGKI